MPTKDQENETLIEAFEDREAGVAEMVDFYEAVEEVYRQASASLQENPSSYTSDSTNSSGSCATLG